MERSLTQQQRLNYLFTYILRMPTLQQISRFNKISLALMTVGYFWLWTFNRDPNVLIKFISLQAYLLTWVYFLILVLRKNDIFGINVHRLFQLNFVLQIIVSAAYWFMLHGPMVSSKRFPRYEIWWNVYVHVLPMILLIVDYGINKRNLYNNWKDTFVFYYFIALPINLIYSHFQKPVYFFLAYRSMSDYVIAILLGAIMILVHLFCYHFSKGWNRKGKQLRKKAEQLAEHKN